jgi:hypothetical protein
MAGGSMSDEKKSTSVKSGRGGYREGAGRKEGVPNKINGEIRDMIRSALEEAGGTKYLLAQAHDNPVAFMGLIGKIIPKEVEAHVTGEISWPVPKGKLG